LVTRRYASLQETDIHKDNIMRLLTSLSMLAFVAMAAPTMAQDTPAPATQAPPATEAPASPSTPAAAAPAKKTAAPEGVSDEIDKMLWCGHAFSEVSAQAKAGGDQNTADQMGPLGAQLIEQGSTALTEGGIDANRLAEIKVAYAQQINTELQGTGANAKFNFQECIALVQPPTAPATPATPAEPAKP
jgi:hypothetical protein